MKAVGVSLIAVALVVGAVVCAADPESTPPADCADPRLLPQSLSEGIRFYR